MASLRKIAKSPYWIACYRDREGKQKNKSTELLCIQANKQKAQKIADAFEGAYKTKNCKDNLREKFNSIAREIEPDSRIYTVGEYFKNWTVVYGKELSPRTLVSYIHQMKQFEQYYGTDKTMESVKQVHALGFRCTIAKKASNVTANHAIKIMRAIFGRAMNEGVIIGNPFVVNELQDDSVSKQAFTMEQVKRLMEVADPEWQSLMRFAIFTGQRLGDLVDLTWANIDFTNKEILFTTQKTGRLMALPASDELWSHIETLPRGLPTAPLHPRAYNLKHRSNVGSVSKDFTRLMVTAGLCKEKPNNKKRDKEGDVSREVNPLTFHSMRHALASWLRNAGVSESLAMEIIGHDSVSVDRAYVHTEPDRLRQALNKIKLS